MYGRANPGAWVRTNLSEDDYSLVWIKAALVARQLLILGMSFAYR